MKMTGIMLGTALAIGTLQTPTASADTPASLSLSYYEQLRDIEFDDATAVAVKGFTLVREQGVFELTEGTLAFAHPIAGRPCAAIFHGEGRFRYTPPNAVERGQLRRFLKDTVIDQRFRDLFILFADSTLEQLTEGDHEPVPDPEKAVKGMRVFRSEAVRYYAEWYNVAIAVRMIDRLISGRGDGFFYSHFSEKRGKPFFFEVDPSRPEEVRFSTRGDDRRWQHTRRTICQHHTIEEHAATDVPAWDEKPRLTIPHYTIDATLKGNGDLERARADMTCTAVGDTVWTAWLSFLDLKLDSVDATSRSVELWRPQETWRLQVRFDPPMSPGESDTLTLFYHGDMMVRTQTGFALSSATSWYPSPMDRNYATYDMVFRTPEKFDFVSAGTRQSEEPTDNLRVTRWTHDEPVLHTSFNVGYFDKNTIEAESIPTIHIWVSEEFRTSGSMKKGLAADVANATNLFTTVFGPCSDIPVTATDILYRHGQAFPGLIHLSRAAIRGTGTEGYIEQFFAHEVAHMWWGMQVGIESYHDQWLEEAFAEYSGLLYVQHALKDNKKFFNLLKEMGDGIFDNRKYMFGSGQEAGPIWLGYRTESDETAGDYGLIIYEKGAWVLHMLRNMMIDLTTMREDRFFDMLRDYYSTFKGATASTREFQTVVEHHVGRPMDWFFDQWVYGTDLPEYHIEYSIEPDTEKEGWALVGTIRQEGVPEGFGMPLPVAVRLGADSGARFRIAVEQPTVDFRYHFEQEPLDVQFNIYQSVLCRLKVKKK